jgi:hypothetical protein
VGGRVSDRIRPADYEKANYEKIVVKLMPRYFTLSESEKLLPKLERVLRSAVLHKAEYEKADQELDSTLRHVRISGGAQINRGDYLACRARRDTSAVAMKESITTIEETGALVKDLDMGLIDFLSMYRGQEVCLCWKLGEDSIRFWHGTDEGFRGRKPIDEDFLERHRGEGAETPN